MNDVPRQKLIEIVTHRQAVTARTGRDVLSDAKLCEALLRDLCGEHKREIFVLVAALKEHVAADLLTAQVGVPPDVLFTRLTRRLHDNLALTEEAARWAVESWALALGVVLAQPIRPAANIKPIIGTGSVAPVAPVTARSSAAQTLVSNLSHDRLRLTFTPGVIMDFVRVPAGEFLMGAADTDRDAFSDEKPQHKVYLDEYFIGTTPVTVAQFATFVQATGYSYQAGLDVKNKANHPIIHVIWHEAVAFCDWVTQSTGKKIRLPTEAEWEKAARGTDGRIYPWGTTRPTDNLCNFDNSVGSTTAVGQYSPLSDSPYGCRDMAGNVREWVQDWYSDKYYTSLAVRNPTGPASGNGRVRRGGSWNYVAALVRASYRGWVIPVNRDDGNGFRCAH